MKNELPKNWVIDTHAEKESPLMPKFKNWFNEINKQDNLFIFKYYGVNEGKCFCSDNDCFQLITLEEWNAFYFPEWHPKQGEVVLVSNIKSNVVYHKCIFVVKHNETYYCEDKSDITNLVAWKYIKPLPKEPVLQPLIDNLKAEADKLGLKANVTFE